MKLPTVKNILRKKHKTDTSGYITLRIGVPGNKTPFLRSYSYSVGVSQWNAEDEVVKKNHDDYNQINAEITKERDRVLLALTAAARGGKTITDSYISSLFDTGQVSGSFLQFYAAHLEVITKRFSAGYSNHFLIEYKAIKKFAPDLAFEAVTAEMLHKYELSIHSSPNTLCTKMKRLKEVVMAAIERGHIKIEQIAGYKWPAYKEPVREYLTLAETERIGKEIYAGTFSHDKELQKVACYFLVECYAGVRVSDWPSFRVETLVNGDMFKCRAKKNGEPIYLPLSHFPRLRAILDYIRANSIVFDISGQAANRLLKFVAKEAKINKRLTTHIGRHTCATLLAEIGYSAYSIGEVLGISEQTAKTYRHNTRQALRGEIDKLGGL